MGNDGAVDGAEIGVLYMSNLNKYDTDKWLLYINQTKNATDVLDYGDYTYRAYVSDNSSNWNSTEERSITLSSGITPLTDCGNLDTQGANYILQNNVSSTSGCFNVMADDIVMGLVGVVG